MSLMTAFRKWSGQAELYDNEDHAFAAGYRAALLDAEPLTDDTPALRRLDDHDPPVGN